MAWRIGSRHRTRKRLEFGCPSPNARRIALLLEAGCGEAHPAVRGVAPCKGWCGARISHGCPVRRTGQELVSITLTVIHSTSIIR